MNLNIKFGPLTNQTHLIKLLNVNNISNGTMRAARRPAHKHCHLELINHISVLNKLMLKYCNIGNAEQIYMKYTYNISIYIFSRREKQSRRLKFRQLQCTAIEF